MTKPILPWIGGLKATMPWRWHRVHLLLGVMYCQCGCGGVTKTYQTTNSSLGQFRGNHQRFLKGHRRRVNRPMPADFIVDDCDAELLRKHYWYVDPKLGYAYTSVNGKRVYLHRLITNAPAGAIVLYLDGNSHNNTRGNLFVRGRANVSQTLPENLDDGFGHWFAGFVDGEGCFQISENAIGKRGIASYRCIFDVSLRFDDADILKEVQRRTGAGTLTFFQPGGRRAAPAVRWQVKNKEGALFLTKLFDKYPLRAKKAKDYEIWRKAVLSWHDGTKGSGLRADYSVMADCRKALLTLRNEGRVRVR